MADLQDRVVRYQLAMSMARTMLSRGIISEEKYHEIDTIIANKYGLSSSTIYRVDIHI